MPISRDTGYRQAPPPTTTTGTTTPQTPTGGPDISQTIDDALGQIQGSGAYGPSPIGVGPGFTVTQPYGYLPGGRSGHAPGSHGFDLGGGPGGRTIGPRYFADDEYKPANLQPNVIADIQAKMAFVGLYDPNAVLTSGDWGEETASAFRRLLAYANQHGLRWEVALSNLRSQVQGGGGPGAPSGRMRIDENGNLVPADTPPDRQPLTIQQTDPRTLNLALREAAMNLTGRALSPDEVQDMTAAYNSLESQRQTEAYNLQVQGGTYLDIPSPQTYAESEILARHPEEVATEQGRSYLSDAMQMLASPAWGIR